MEMPRQTILRVDRVSKLFARRNEATRRRLAHQVSHAFFGARPKQSPPPRKSEFWALDQVSFELKRGEALGVIGLNGSGKTTLLRILAGQILPDQGEIWVSGSTAAMIDLHAGFQPSETGRQNIYLRAAALGFTRRQTESMIEDIIDFAELGDAIEGPMANYSSGMKMRLAFAVMAMVQPDILFIDEVLAVGDFRFRQKCLARIREMRARSAFVLVSHSMGDISRFCDRVVVLHKGQLVFSGNPDEAIAYYHELEQSSHPIKAAPKQLIPATVNRPDALDQMTFEWIGANGAGDNELIEGGTLKANVSFRVHYKPYNLVVGIPIYDHNGTVLTGFATDACDLRLEAEAGSRVALELTVPDIVLNPGRYRAAVGITDGTEFLYMDELPDLIVRPRGRKSWGYVSIQSGWTVSISAKSTESA